MFDIFRSVSPHGSIPYRRNRIKKEISVTWDISLFWLVKEVFIRGVSGETRVRQERILKWELQRAIIFRFLTKTKDYSFQVVTKV